MPVLINIFMFNSLPMVLSLVAAAEVKLMGPPLSTLTFRLIVNVSSTAKTKQNSVKMALSESVVAVHWVCEQGKSSID